MFLQNATKSLSDESLGFPGADSPKNCTSRLFPVFLKLETAIYHQGGITV